MDGINYKVLAEKDKAAALAIGAADVALPSGWDDETVMTYWQMAWQFIKFPADKDALPEMLANSQKSARLYPNEDGAMYVKIYDFFIKQFTKPGHEAQLVMWAEKADAAHRYDGFAASRDFKVTDAEIDANEAAYRREIDEIETRYRVRLAELDAQRTNGGAA